MQERIGDYVVSTMANALMIFNIEYVLERVYTMAFSSIKTREMSGDEEWSDYRICNNIYEFGELNATPKEDIDKIFIEITEEEFYNFNPNKQ